MNAPKKNHGGRHPGAGRLATAKEPTVVKRIPASLVPAVDAIILSARLSVDLPLGAFH